MTSKQAERLLDDRLKRNPEGMPFEEAKMMLQSKCSIAENTSEAYLRRSDVAVMETDLEGSKVIVHRENASPETVVHNEDEVLNKEVGEPTGRKFGELDVLEPIDHPQIPTEHEDGYIRRRMGSMGSSLSSRTDVQVVTATMQDPDFSTLLIGKHGIGKDKLILHICAKTNRPVIRLVGNDDSDFIDLLIGTYAPNSDGNFEHRKGLFTIAAENGYTMVIDEFNSLSGKVQTSLNMMLESADQNQLVIPETNEVIEPHPQFRFVASMNPNTIGYGGREELDSATGSRFFPVELPPLDSDSEKRVVAGQTHWNRNDRELDTLIGGNGVITSIRSLHDSSRVSTWVSTRDVIQIGRMAERLGDVKSAAELVLVGRASIEDKESIRTAIEERNW